MPEFKIDKKTHTVWLDAGGGATSKEADEAKVLAHLQRMINRPVGLLPPVIRWISPLRRWLILEQPPRITTIFYRAAKAQSASDNELVKETIFEIPLPWTAELICLDNDFYPTSVATFALRGPITTQQVSIGVLPLPNFYVSSFICMPPRDMNTAPIGTLGEGIILGHNLSWHGGFNTDTLGGLKICAKYRRPAALFSDLSADISPSTIYKLWEKISLEDVIAWKDWLEPRGFGSHAEGGDPAQSLIYNITQQCLAEESQLLDINSVLYFCNQSLSLAANES